MSKFSEIAKKWQNRWEDAKIFESNPNSKEKYFLTVPYPYVSGPYHIGHGRAYVTGDAFAKYQRISGKNVLYPMAYHVTGTPVLAISLAIEKGDEKKIKLMKEYVALYIKDKKEIDEIVDSFREPLNIYNFFSKRMRSDFKSIGVGIDWRRDFATADPIYNKFVEWQFDKLKNKGYIIKGSYPILYCVSCENAVGEDDIQDGDQDKVSVNEFTLLKYKYKDMFLVAATLRPETIFGQTNIWLNPNAIYKIIEIKIKENTEKWVLSEEAVNKLRYQKKIKIIGDIKANELFGNYVNAEMINKKLIILPANFVDPKIGSGIVTCVPSHAPIDYVGLKYLQDNHDVLKKYNIDPELVDKIELCSIISMEGYKEDPAKEIAEKMNLTLSNEEGLEEAKKIIYKKEFHTGKMKENCGFVSGLPVEEAKDKVKQEMLDKNYADLFYEPSRKSKCRCGGEIVVATLEDQWFLDYSSKVWKQQVRDYLDKMKIYPEKYKKWFYDTVDWLHKRPCARKRGLGTRFPYDKDWIIESLSDSTIYMAFYTIVHHIKKNNILPEQLTKEFFNYVFLNEKSLDEVSKNTRIPKELIEKMHKEYDYYYPQDQRNTCIMHVSNHLTFSLFHHIAIFPEEKMPKLYTLFEPMISNGSKMSKSKGNVIPLAKVNEKYGADLFRLYMLHSAEFASILDWKEEEVLVYSKKLDYFFTTISKIIDLNKNNKNITEPNKNYLIFKNKFYSNIISAKKAMKKYNVRKYIQILFYDNLNLYDEFINSNLITKENINISIIEDWLVLLSPVIPHICEELWEDIGHNNFVLNQVTNKDIFVDYKLLKEYNFVKYIIDDIEKIKKILKKENISKVKIVTAPYWHKKIINKIKENLEKNKGKIEFSEIIKELREVEELSEHKSELAKLLKSYISRINDYRKEENTLSEETILKKHMNIIESKFKSEVIINPEENINKLALINKPGILIE